MGSLADDIEKRLPAGRGAALLKLGQGRGLSATGLETGPVAAFLAGASAAAPFIGRCIAKEDLPGLLAAPAEDSFADLLRSGALADPRAALRARKRRAALLLALADLAGVWSMEQTASRLSAFADACVEAALRAAWEEVAGLAKADIALPAAGPVPGLAAIAMGKLGGRELNYSSDIDLVIVFEPGRMPLGPNDRLGPKDTAVRVTRAMLSILSDRTGDGYVFRTDLRLRPDPGTTAPAVTIMQAERYYETYGQNWERAAHIKARPCAGDAQVGADYMEVIRPFVWRRTLDYGALADIRAVKRQIHAKVGSPEITVSGGDVKLGPGGIREVEFFVQTQQLILGGRDPSLRAASTLDALAALGAAGHVEPDTAQALAVAYRVLRDTEHRIQMIEDAPSQTVPENEEERRRLAALYGSRTLESFESAVHDALLCVHDAYAELFDAPEAEEQPPGSLVFTGVEDDPRTLKTLSEMGFANPSAVAGAIRGWHKGALPAAKSPRAREVLTSLVPRMLGQAAGMEDPDEAFAAFSRFLSLLPTGLQLFSLFTVHPHVLDDVVALCAASPELASRMGKRPSLVHRLLSEDKEPVPPPAKGAVLEEVMDEVRRHVAGERLHHAAALTLGRGDPYEAGRALSDLADDALGVLWHQVRHEMGTEDIPDVAVIAFGRLGAQGMTVRSDLDLVFVHDGPPGAGKPVLRFVRKLLAALSAPTAEGVLYEVDMKLRPSGGAGPAAVTIEAFERYYRDTARIWEMMALTKARVVCAPAPLQARIDEVVAARIAAPRKAAEVKAAAREMREKLMTGHPPKGPLDVKRMSGGLTDLDFVAQVLTLCRGEAPRPPRATPDALIWHGDKGALGAEDAAALLDRHRLFESLAQYSRATFGVTPAGHLSAAQAERLARLSGTQEVLQAIEAGVADIASRFDRLMA